MKTLLWFAELMVGLYTMLLPIAQWGFLISLVVLVPLAFMRRMRRFAGSGLFYASYLFGAVTWLLGATVTYSSYGWIGLVIGLLILGAGVIPMAIFAAFFKMHLPDLGISLMTMTAITLGSRFAGAYVKVKAEEDAEQKNSL